MESQILAFNPNCHHCEHNGSDSSSCTSNKRLTLMGLKGCYENICLGNQKQLACGCDLNDHGNHKIGLLSRSDINHICSRHFHGLEWLNLEGDWWKNSKVCNSYSGRIATEHHLHCFYMDNKGFHLREKIIVVSQGAFVTISNLFLVSSILLLVSLLILSFFYSLAFSMVANRLVC